MWMECIVYQTTIHESLLDCIMLHAIIDGFFDSILYIHVQWSVFPFTKCLIGKCSPPLLHCGCQSILQLISAFLKFVGSYLYMYIFKKAPWKHCPDQDTLNGGCALHKFTFLTFFYPGFSWRQLHFLDTPGNICQIHDCRLANSLKFWMQSMWLH